MENIKSIEIILKNDHSNKIFVNFKERSVGFYLENNNKNNNIINHIIYKLNILSYDIFHTEYSKVHFDNSDKYEHHASFKRMHRIEILFSSIPDDCYIIIQSKFFNFTVNSKKYSYL